jgi:hypothetical protein
MKKTMKQAIFLVLIMLIGNVAFAVSVPSNTTPLVSNQKVLFDLGDTEIERASDIYDLGYDKANGELYIIVRTDSKEVDSADGDSGTVKLITTKQYIYSLKLETEVENLNYPTISNYNRLGIEFEGSKTWSIEQSIGAATLDLNNSTPELLKPDTAIVGRGFAIQGDQVLFYLRGCDDQGDFLIGEIQPNLEEGGTILNVDIDHPIKGGLSEIKGYDLSANGEEIVFVGNREKDEIVVVRMDRSSREIIRSFSIERNMEEYETVAFDLYTTKDHIVVLSKAMADDEKTAKGYIERFTYDGKLVDTVEIDFCVNTITEGPNGSTIYIQRRGTDDIDQNKSKSGVWEAIQINWESKSINGSGPKSVIQEKTRAGHTVARFTDSQFGLLRIEEPETGIVDYQAPIRSNESLVKLQIPYGDIKAKFESGVRNLLVYYQDQELVFPMELFACDDMLAAMPCQSDATIEIIMQTDEAGNVTFEVQLFVVEQVNGMTRVVHRKTIQ